MSERPSRLSASPLAMVLVALLLGLFAVAFLYHGQLNPRSGHRCGHCPPDRVSHSQKLPTATLSLLASQQELR